MLLSVKRKYELELHQKMEILKGYEVLHNILKICCYLRIHAYRTLSNSILQRSMNMKKYMIEIWQQSKHCKPKGIQLFLSKHNVNISKR